jgi:hypothetical protein
MLQLAWYRRQGGRLVVENNKHVRSADGESSRKYPLKSEHETKMDVIKTGFNDMT